MLILTSDRGFAGGYNANVLRTAQGLRALLAERGVEPVTYVVGQRGIAWHRFRSREMAEQWIGFSEISEIRQRPRRGRHGGRGVRPPGR